ncbi:MAG: site-specific recombinase, partial [Janthinobacterium lividum]
LKHQRTHYLLDWLDTHAPMRRTVQATLQKTLREAVGPELFCATGLAREPAFFSELSEQMMKLVLPTPPAQMDLSSLFVAMFPQPADADWLTGLDAATLARLWKLAADDSIVHAYRQQIDEALVYLVTVIIATGISPDFRQRLEPRLSLQATPFMSLRRELERYLLAPHADDAALRSVRMLIAVCQAQTDRIYAHLDEFGVSVGLVYHIERMRSQLTRMARLIDLRNAAPHSVQGSGQVQALLVDLIHAHHQRSSVRGLVRRSFALLARKMVERNATHGEKYIARDGADYRSMFKAACIGGVVTAFTVCGKLALSGPGVARFFDGLFASINYAVSFMTISALGAVLATKQPAVTAPALAAKMVALDTVDGLRSLMVEIAWILRSQAAAVFGNLMSVIPTMLTIALLIPLAFDAPLMDASHARKAMADLSLIGVTPLFAAFTGVLLWLSSLFAGFADNWFALRRLREALMHQRRLVYALGPARAERLANWLEHHVVDIAGNLSLALMLGMLPVLAHFFGLPLDVRHVTLSTGTLTAAAAGIGFPVLREPSVWLAVAGIAVIGLLNVGVAFGCALTLALQAREVPKRIRRLVRRAMVRAFAKSPRSFLFPQPQAQVVAEEPVSAAMHAEAGDVNDAVTVPMQAEAGDVNDTATAPMQAEAGEVSDAAAVPMQAHGRPMNAPPEHPPT